MKEIQVTRYETEDGLIFDTYEEAASYEKGLSAVAILKSLDEAIKKMEIPLEGKTPELIPLSYFLDAGCSYTGVYSKLKGAGFRYFNLRTSLDADRLAAYVIARKQAEEGKEVKRHSDNYKEIDEMLDETELGNFPCLAFISDYDYPYGDRIGTFLGEVELIEKYCRHNGYEVTLKKISR